MGKIILNPEDGAEIKNFVFQNEHYMDAKEGQSFLPGMVVRVNDDLADFMIETWGFLRELSPEEAKEYMESKDDIKCERCDFHTKFKIAFDSHKRKHEREANLDDLGIPVIGPKTEVRTVESSEERRAKYEAENRSQGLEGPGLQDDQV